MRQEPLLFAVLLAVAGGLGSGCALRRLSLTSREIELVGER